VTQENFGYDTEDRNKYCQIIRWLRSGRM
jgi:hypothetical protein